MIVGAHYDTKDSIPGFVGANDGASGVALLLELARALPRRLAGPSVQLVAFDAEEARGDREFDADGIRGSRQYVEYARAGGEQGSVPIDRIRAAMVFDLIGDCELQIPYESNSDRDLYAGLASAAAELYGDPAPFESKSFPISDDHLPFIEAGIPGARVHRLQLRAGSAPGRVLAHGRGHTRQGLSGEPRAGGRDGAAGDPADPVTRIGAPIRALADVFRNPDLGRLQLAWAGVSLAMWSFAIGLGVYAFDAAGAAAVGLAGLARLLPGALASPFGGLLGDRHSRRAVLIWSTFAATGALAAASLAVGAGAPTWSVFALAGLYTAVSSPYVPAEAALVPQLARTPQELSAANVAHSVMDNLGFLGGSILTGALLAFASVQAVFAVAAIAAAVSLIALATMRPDARPAYASEAAPPASFTRPRSAFGRCSRILRCGCSGRA